MEDRVSGRGRDKVVRYRGGRGGERRESEKKEV